jgi:branched-chain amino acid transport system ATP-binding protein
VESLLGHVTALRDEGRTILFVEHDMDVVMSISDRVVCMAQGSIIAEGTPDEIRRNEQVTITLLGSPVTT